MIRFTHIKPKVPPLPQETHGFEFDSMFDDIVGVPLRLKRFFVVDHLVEEKQTEWFLFHFVCSCSSYPPTLVDLKRLWTVWKHVRPVLGIIPGCRHPNMGVSNPFDACVNSVGIDHIQDSLISELHALWENSTPAEFAPVWESVVLGDPYNFSNFEAFKFMVIFLNICESADFRRFTPNPAITRKTAQGSVVTYGNSKCMRADCALRGEYKDVFNHEFYCANCPFPAS
jgi:hypothetical protein